MKKLISGLCILLFFVSYPVLSQADRVWSVLRITREDNPSLASDVNVYEDADGRLFAFLPQCAPEESVVIRADAPLRKVTGKDLISSDAAHGTLTCRAADGATVTVDGHTLTVMRGSLPAMNLTVGAGHSIEETHESRDVKIPVSVGIEGTENGEFDLAPSDAEIKTRGYTTFEYEKKPYQIKFDKKVDLFGMGKAKKWILLANYLDGTALRNRIVFDLGEKIGCRFTPSSVFVDLYIDGDYCGVYQLAEKCEIGSSRVDVSDPYAVLLELDVRERLDASDIYFTLPISGKAVVFKDYVTDFEETTDAEVIKQARDVRAHIKNQLILFESVLYSKDAPWSEIESRIDVDSFIRYFFISEFTEEVDATFASTFFYIDGKDDVIHCDPLWDYDRCLGFGTEYSRDTREDFLKNISVITDELRAEWFKQLFRYPEFARRVNGMYDSCIKEALDSDAICGAVDRYLSELHDSLMMNFTRYTDIFVGLDDPAKNHFNGESDVTIERQIGYAANEMKRWIRERAEFTESAFGGDMPILRYSAASSDGTLGKSYTGGFTEGTSNVGGMKLELLRSGVGGGIEYSIAYAGKTYGPASDGEELIGGYDRITGISVKLTGAAAKFYSVEYRALLPSGRTGEWARDGGIAGAVNGSFSRFGVKAFEVRLIKKIFAAAGDADGDGALTMKDVLMIRRSIAGIGTIPDGRADICDVDGDGDVTMKDVLMLRRSIAGLL